MLYIKVTKGDTVTAEAIENPVYIRTQTKNNILVICPEQYAKGILSKDGSAIYQLADRDDIGGDRPTAEIIYQADYEQIMAGVRDPEDDDPTPLPDEPDAEILTRAQLTAKVAELEDQLSAAKILLGVTE